MEKIIVLDTDEEILEILKTLSGAKDTTSFRRMNESDCGEAIRKLKVRPLSVYLPSIESA
jgi:hypothetical protein